MDLDNLDVVLKVGDATGGNYHETGLTGTPRLRGTATVWKDMISDIFGKNLNATPGKVDSDWDNSAIVFQSGGSIAVAADRIQANLEINHEFKVGTGITFYPHIHWFQDAATQFELTLESRVQRNGEPMTTAWTTTTLTANDVDDVYPYVSGTLNQITAFPPVTIDCSISDTVQFRMARTDALAGDMLVYFMDMHGEIDSQGSDETFAKEA